MLTKGDGGAWSGGGAEPAPAWRVRLFDSPKRWPRPIWTGARPRLQADGDNHRVQYFDAATGTYLGQVTGAVLGGAAMREPGVLGIGLLLLRHWRLALPGRCLAPRSAAAGVGGKSPLVSLTCFRPSLLHGRSPRCQARNLALSLSFLGPTLATSPTHGASMSPPMAASW